MLFVGAIASPLANDLYLELKNNIKKIGGLDIALEMFNNFLKEEYKK